METDIMIKIRNCFRILNEDGILQEEILSNNGYWKCYGNDKYEFYVHDMEEHSYLVGEFFREHHTGTYEEWYHEKISEEKAKLRELEEFVHSEEYLSGRKDYEKFRDENEQRTRLLTEKIIKYEEEQLDKIESKAWKNEREENLAYKELHREIEGMLNNLKKTKEYQEVEKRQHDLVSGKYKKYFQIDDLLSGDSDIKVAISNRIEEREWELKLEQEGKNQEYKRLLCLFEELLRNSEDVCFGQVDEEIHFDEIKIVKKKRYQEITIEELASLNIGCMIPLSR